MKSDGQKTVVLQNVKIKMDIFYLLKKNECSEIRLKIVIYEAKQKHYHFSSWFDFLSPPSNRS